MPISPPPPQKRLSLPLTLNHLDPGKYFTHSNSIDHRSAKLGWLVTFLAYTSVYRSLVHQLWRMSVLGVKFSGRRISMSPGRTMTFIMLFDSWEAGLISTGVLILKMNQWGSRQEKWLILKRAVGVCPRRDTQSISFPPFKFILKSICETCLARGTFLKSLKILQVCCSETVSGSFIWVLRWALL